MPRFKDTVDQNQDSHSQCQLSKSCFKLLILLRQFGPLEIVKEHTAKMKEVSLHIIFLQDFVNITINIVSLYLGWRVRTTSPRDAAWATELLQRSSQKYEKLHKYAWEMCWMAQWRHKGLQVSLQKMTVLIIIYHVRKHLWRRQMGDILGQDSSSDWVCRAPTQSVTHLCSPEILPACWITPARCIFSK